MNRDEAGRAELSEADYATLAAFRHALRRYLSAVSANAAAVGLTHHQHQALLSIKGGYPGRTQISVGELAEHLVIKNHTALGHVAQLEQAGLVSLDRAASDRRKVMVSITPKGEAVLRDLADASFRELRILSGPLGALARRIGDFEEDAAGARANKGSAV